MQDLLNKIDRLLKEKKFFEVKNIVKDENAADLAVLFDELFGEVFGEKTEFMILFRLLPKDLAAETFAHMNSDMQSHLIQMFSDKEIRDILDESFIDDTVDIIEEMPANVVSRILKNSTTGERKAINEILRYPKDSAGSIMTIEYVSLHKDMTVSEAFEKIRKVGVNKETIYTCYVTENRKLIGVITVKDLFMADEDDKIADIMETHIISVDTLEDKEIVGHMFRKYDFLALPVVDKDNRLVGIVTFDDAMDVIQDENTEDFSKMAAIAPNEESYFRTGIFKHAKSRIVWLLILMISATITQIITNPISYRKHLSGKNLDCRGRRSPPPAPKTSGIYDKITDISKMRKKRTADWPDYHSEHLTKEKSGNRLLSLLRREVIPLCHRNNDNKKEECISYIPLFRPELFRKKSTGNG